MTQNLIRMGLQSQERVHDNEVVQLPSIILQDQAIRNP